MRKMRFSLQISAEKYQLYYRGSAKFVKVTATDGRTLKFPANALQKFVSHDGINGQFEIVFDENNRLLSLIRL